MLTLFFEKIALVGALVHTLEPATEPRPAAVVIRADRIEAVLAPDDPALAGLPRIDLKGAHLVPGLIDAFVNFDADHDRLYLSHGITLARDVGADLTQMIAERDSLARNRNPGPSLLIAGAVLDGPNPATRSSIVLASREEAVDKLSRLLELGPIDFFSIHLGLPEPAWRGALEFAHRQQRPMQVWGPLPRGIRLEQAIEARQDGIFHLEALLPEGRSFETVSDAELDAVVAKLAKSELCITPTLAAYAQRLVPPRKDLPELAYLGPITVAQWLGDAAQREQTFQKSPELLERGLKSFARQSELVARLYRAGVGLVPGSAAGQMPWLLPGESFVNELKLWVRAGIPAADVLRMATEGSARKLGFTIQQYGTITAGKTANLVALDGDPRQDLGVFAHPREVWIRGRGIDAAELKQLREALAQRQRELQKLSFAPLEIQSPALPAGELVLSGLCETTFANQRLRGERWAIVRSIDGGLYYCARIVSLGTASTADTSVTLQQKLLDNQLVALKLEVQSGPRIVTLEGELAAGTLNLQQRLNGIFQKTIRIRERMLFLDTGSITADLILGQHGQPGSFKALFLEDFEPAKGDYSLQIQPNGERWLEAPLGKRVVEYAADGSVLKVLRQQGNGLLLTRQLEAQVSGEAAARVANPLAVPR